jgi:Zn-dependent M32 family carboxypeptidase
MGRPKSKSWRNSIPSIGRGSTNIDRGDPNLSNVETQKRGNWLREKFFVRGRRLTLDEIMQQGTGEPITDRYLTAI